MVIGAAGAGAAGGLVAPAPSASARAAIHPAVPTSKAIMPTIAADLIFIISIIFFAPLAKAITLPEGVGVVAQIFASRSGGAAWAVCAVNKPPSPTADATTPLAPN